MSPSNQVSNMLSGFGRSSAEAPPDNINVSRQRRALERSVMRPAGTPEENAIETELRAQLERDDSLFTAALGKLVGLSEIEGRKIIELIYSEPEIELRTVIERQFRDQSLGRPESIKELEAQIEEYETWARSVLADPVWQKVSELNIDQAAMQAALEASGARWFDLPESSNEPIYMSREQASDFQIAMNFLEGCNRFDTLFECLGRLAELSDGRLVSARAILSWSKELQQLGKSSMQDLLTQVLWHHFSHSQYGEDSVRYWQFARPGYRAYVATFSPATEPAVNHVIGLLPFAIKIEKSGGKAIAGLLPVSAEVDTWLKHVANGISSLADSGADLRTVETLLRASAGEARMALFDALVGAPDRVQLVKQVSRYSLNLSGAINFLISFSRPEKAEQVGGDLVGALIALAKEKKFGPLVAFLIGEGSNLLDVPSGYAQLNQIQHNPYAYLLLRAGLNASQEGLVSQVAVLSKLARHTLPVSEVENLVWRVQALSEQKLAELDREFHQAPDLAHAIRSIKFEMKVTSRQPSKSKIGKVDWQADILREVKKMARADTLELDLASVSEAMKQDWKGLPGRIQLVEQQNCRLLVPFCEDVVAFGAAPIFREMVYDSIFFGRYLTKLKSDPAACRSVLGELILREPENAHRVLADWLCRTERQSRPPEIVEVPSVLEALHFEIKEHHARRLLVWGRIDSEKARHSLQDVEGPVEVVFKDVFGKRDTPHGSIQGYDIVLCCTDHIGHQLYYKIKREAARVQAGFYHLDRRGVDILRGVIEGIQARYIAA